MLQPCFGRALKGSASGGEGPFCCSLDTANHAPERQPVTVFDSLWVDLQLLFKIPLNWVNIDFTRGHKMELPLFRRFLLAYNS